MTRYALQNRILETAAAPALLFILGSFTGGLTGRPLGLAHGASGPAWSNAHAPRGLPQPEPLIFSDIDPQSARQINAAIPLSTAPLAAARPFAFVGDADSREMAIDCLGAAMWFEAGSDDGGQRAVAQVVLNRVRHPAFPATVCGVVFQGSERSTGCQFTFTCDGALRRHPSALAWSEARARARSALDGQVDAAVGLATHYHTDWVHPVWSSKLDKIAQVGTHLFFRWGGKWGQADAMRQAYSPHEQPVAKLAALSPIHRAAFGDEDIRLAAANLAPTDGDAVATSAAATLASLDIVKQPAAKPEGLHFIEAPARGNGGSLAMEALAMCGSQRFCKVVGWREGSDRGEALPISATDREAVAFLYIRDQRTGVDRAMWDCSRFERQNRNQCFGADRARWIDFNGNFQSDRRSGAQNI